MKYIRTKNGIYEVADVTKDLTAGKTRYFCKTKNNSIMLVVDETNVIKQANTIVELCDEVFLGHKKQDKYYQFPYIWCFLMPIKVHQSYNEKKYDYYGAIWVKGEFGEPILKSVARVNEKGELELL